MVGMKRLFFCCFMFLCTYIVYAQSSICGVPFGQPYNVAKTHLFNKYGEPEIDDKNEIWYFERDYAGIPFEFIFFKFQSDGYLTYFNECVMGRRFDDLSLAKNFRSKIIKKLKSKYENVVVYKDNNGFIAACGGESPTNTEEYGFNVFVDHSDKTYTVFLDYGPYNYVNEEL